MPSGAPQRKPRPLPPNVLDLKAPQYAFQETRAKAPRQRRPAAGKQRAPRRLTASEKRLVAWMYGRLGFRFGAQAVVRQYGARAILECVHDGIMIWTENHVGSYVDGQRVVKTIDERIVNPRIVSPPAYLCHLLKGLDLR